MRKFKKVYSLSEPVGFLPSKIIGTKKQIFECQNNSISPKYIGFVVVVFPYILQDRESISSGVPAVVSK